MSENLWQSIEPGHKLQKLVAVATPAEMPVTLIGGTSDGPDVLITTGIHGSEYPATLAAIELAQAWSPEDISGRLVMIHPVNASAFRARVSAVMPETGLNLNRMFPGSPQGGPAERLAWWLTGHSDAADFYLDLHSGDLYEELTSYVYFPGNASEPVVTAAIEAAKVLDMPLMVRSFATTGAYNSAALRGTPSLLLERGGAGFCLRRDVELYKKDIRNLLKHLGMLKGPLEPAENNPVEMAKVIYLESNHHGLWQVETEVGGRVAKGQCLGRVLDLFGQTVEEFRAEMDGTVLYQLYTLSTNPGDVLVAYGA